MEALYSRLCYACIHEVANAQSTSIPMDRPSPGTNADLAGVEILTLERIFSRSGEVASMGWTNLVDIWAVFETFFRCASFFCRLAAILGKVGR
jgi:hypothetical protein